MIKSTSMRIIFASATVICALSASAPSFAANVQINPLAGFTDSTPATPIGGNPGTTVGQQRLNAFQRAANIWGARLQSNVTITIDARFTPLACQANQGTLGSAGPNNGFINFPNAPLANVIYPIALANSKAGSDLDPSQADIDSNFNSNLGTTGCLQNSSWYYGYDGNTAGNQIDFLSVLLHELGHGLGFLTFMNKTTGAKATISGIGRDDIYLRFLEGHGASPSDFPSMTDAQRLAASTSGTNLHFVGPSVIASSDSLSAGKTGTHVQMYAPNPVVSGSSVSHWNTTATPNAMMEPSYTQPLNTPGLELALFKDLGWGILGYANPTHDFDNTGSSDIAWESTSGGNFALWRMAGGLVKGTNSFSVPGWSLVGQRDFDGDGRADWLFKDGSGNVVMWFLDAGGVAPVVTSALVTTGLGAWSVVGTGDSDANRRGDILWRNSSTGDVALWLMDRNSVIGSTGFGGLGTAWTVVGHADFNGDGKADILWRNTATSEVAIWFLNGTTVTSSVGFGAVAGWSVVATGDVNGDGRADIIWQNGTTTAVWIVGPNGTSISQSIGFTLPAGWGVVQTGDYNGDGKSDLLFRNTGGDTAIWFMNGTTVTSSLSLGNVPAASWTVVSNAAN